MKFEIKYYLTETAKKSGAPAFKEVVQGDKRYVENWAQNKLKHSNFKFFELTKK